MDITDLLKSLVLNKMGGSQQPQTRQSGMGSLAKLAIPMILMALYRNATNKKKAESLGQALGEHEVGSAADSISTDIFSKIDRADTTDGGKILGHVLGRDSDVIASQIAAQAGVSIDQAKTMMSSLAPVIMEMLAEKTKGNRSPEAIQETVREQLQKVDREPDLPGLPDIFRDMLNKQQPQTRTQPRQEEGGLGGLLKDILGGAQPEVEEEEEPSLLDSLGGLGGITDILSKMVR